MRKLLQSYRSKVMSEHLGNTGDGRKCQDSSCTFEVALTGYLDALNT